MQNPNPNHLNRLRIEEARFNKLLEEKDKLHVKWVETSDKLRQLEIAYQELLSLTKSDTNDSNINNNSDINDNKTNNNDNNKTNNHNSNYINDNNHSNTTNTTKDKNTQYATLTRKLIELQGQNKALRNAIHEAKDVQLLFKYSVIIQLKCIILQDKAIKETNRSFATNEDQFPEALMSYEIMVRDKDFEIQNLKDAFNEFRVISKREQRMMVSAWYRLTLETHQKDILNKDLKLDKSSWLSQERLMIKKKERLVVGKDI